MNVKDIKNLEKISAFYGEFAIFKTTEHKEGIINRQGEIILPAEKYEFVFHHCDDVFELWETIGDVTECTKYFDAKLGREVPEPKTKYREARELPEFAQKYQKYEDTRWCADNRIAYRDGALMGIMDESGNVIVAPTYDVILDAHGGKIGVKKDGKQGYIDLDGNVVFPLEYPRVIYQMKLGLYRFCTEDGKWGYMDEKRQVVIPAIYDALDAGETYGLNEIAVKKEGRCYFINAKQEEVKVF